jgi:5-methylcytosine-specific restriction endonuclease McrA
MVMGRPLSGWTKRHKKTFGTRRKKWDGNFRQPPKPKYYWTIKKGRCRWCGEDIFKGRNDYIGEELNKRKSWHGDCATEYMIIYHSREARRHVWLRDRGKCNGCGKQCTRRGWDLDHIKPLLEQKGLKEDELDWTYYGLDNMQTLCRPCHREKTNQDIKKRT